MSLRMLNVKQASAWALVTVLIVASKSKPTYKNMTHIRERLKGTGHEESLLPARNDFALGAIVGMVEFVDCNKTSSTFTRSCWSGPSIA